MAASAEPYGFESGVTAFHRGNFAVARESISPYRDHPEKKLPAQTYIFAMQDERPADPEKEPSEELKVFIVGQSSGAALAAERARVAKLESAFAAVATSLRVPPTSASSAMAVAPATVPRPIDIVIPEIARGFEEVYRRFLGGVLIYKQGTAEEVRLPIAALADPLDGVFDLSGCGDTGQHLSIATGYRKAKKAENASKVETWIAPRFLMERNVSGSAAHYGPIMAGWDGARAPVGIFYDWGNWDNLGWFDYLTTKSFDEVGSNNLHAHTYHIAHTSSMHKVHGPRQRVFHVTF